MPFLIPIIIEAGMLVGGIVEGIGGVLAGVAEGVGGVVGVEGAVLGAAEGAAVPEAAFIGGGAIGPSAATTGLIGAGGELSADVAASSIARGASNISRIVGENPLSVGLGVGAVATGAQTAIGMAQAGKQQAYMQQQAQAQREQNKLEQARANVLTNRERISQVRESRIRRGAILNSAGNAGIGFMGTSGVQGSVGSVQSQVGYNLGTLGQMSDFANQLSAANQKEANAQQGYLTTGAKGAAWQSIFGGVSEVTNRATGYAVNKRLWQTS